MNYHCAVDVGGYLGGTESAETLATQYPADESGQSLTAACQGLIIPRLTHE